MLAGRELGVGLAGVRTWKAPLAGQPTRHEQCAKSGDSAREFHSLHTPTVVSPVLFLGAWSTSRAFETS